MKNPVKVFEPNIEGRDFVIGDLHGAYPCFENLLKNLNFDKSKDRMFSVGDLVDRGPDSLACLRLLREPWFHTVLANHEQMMFHAFTDGKYGASWFKNGGMWGIEAFIANNAISDDKIAVITDDDYDIISLVPLINELPFLITVNMIDGTKFHIIHAELPCGEEVTDEQLADPNEVLRLATIPCGQYDEESFLWNRHLFYNFYQAQLNHNKVTRTVSNILKQHTPFNENLSHIICGHTILQRPMTIVGQTAIDTGAFKSCMNAIPSKYGQTDEGRWEALTCVELASWKFYQATPNTFRTVEPLVIVKESDSGE